MKSTIHNRVTAAIFLEENRDSIRNLPKKVVAAQTSYLKKVHLGPKILWLIQVVV